MQSIKRTAERLYLPTGVAAADPPGSGDGFREHEPAAQLRPYIGRIGVGGERIAPGEEVEERVIPDGAPRLIFNLGDPPTLAGAGAGSPAEIAGASCGPTLLRLSGRIEGVSIPLRAGGAASVLGIPAGELVGRQVSLEELWGPLAAEVLERLAGTPRQRERVKVVEEALLSRLSRRGSAPDVAAAHAVRLLVASAGRMRVRDLAAAVGVGERRLEQLFHRHVGLTPKAMGRLARFHACLRLLRDRPTLPWSRVALECGYYDQSHLVNEFRAIAGASPTELHARIASDSSKTER